MLRQYLDRCGPHRAELLKQEEHVQQLRRVMKCLKDAQAGLKAGVLAKELAQITFGPDGLVLPLRPDMKVRWAGLGWAGLG